MIFIGNGYLLIKHLQPKDTTKYTCNKTNTKATTAHTDTNNDSNNKHNQYFRESRRKLLKPR